MENILFTINQSELLKALTTVGIAINKKNSIPIQTNFRIEIKDNFLIVTGTDQEVQVHTILDIDSTGENGTFCIESEGVLNSLKNIPNMPLSISTTNSGTELNINYGTGDFNFTIVDSSEYTDMKEEFSDCEKSIDLQILSSGINYTEKFVGTDLLRPAMTCIHAELSKKGIILVATDAHMLAKFECEGDYPSESFHITRKVASVLKTIISEYSIKDGENIVSINLNEKNVRFSLCGYTVIARLPEDKYPNFRSVIPKDYEKFISINRNDFQRALNRILSITKGNNPRIIIKVENGDIILNSTEADYGRSAKETIKLNDRNDSDDFITAFNGDNMDIILSNCKCENIRMEYSQHNRAILVLPEQEPNLFHLIMPMIIS